MYLATSKQKSLNLNTKAHCLVSISDAVLLDFHQNNCLGKICLKSFQPLMAFWFMYLHVFKRTCCRFDDLLFVYNGLK